MFCAIEKKENIVEHMLKIEEIQQEISHTAPAQLRHFLERRSYAKAFEYLLVHKHFVLAAFVNAIWEDKKAFQLLMASKAFVWAAMANYINGDDNAAMFLKKNKLEHYAELAHKIQAKIRREGDEGTNFFNSGPFKVNG